MKLSEVDLFGLFIASPIDARKDSNENTVIFVIPNPSEIKISENAAKTSILGKFEGYIVGSIRADGYFGIEKEYDEKGEKINIWYVQYHVPLHDVKYVRTNGEIKVRGKVLDIKTENDKMIVKIYAEDVISVTYPWDLPDLIYFGNLGPLRLRLDEI